MQTFAIAVGVVSCAMLIPLVIETVKPYLILPPRWKPTVKEEVEQPPMRHLYVAMVAKPGREFYFWIYDDPTAFHKSVVRMVYNPELSLGTNDAIRLFDSMPDDIKISS